MTRRFVGLDQDESRFLTQVMTMGQGTSLPVVMQPGEFARLVGCIYRDNGKGPELEAQHPGLWAQIDPGRDYYAIDEAWFLQPVKLFSGQHAALYLTGVEHLQDFKTYLRCLSELHKRRRKYARILQAQPVPTLVQVSPRALLEYGGLAPHALASWLTWRKFLLRPRQPQCARDGLPLRAHSGCGHRRRTAGRAQPARAPG